jgi:hypothetical protein
MQFTWRIMIMFCYSDIISITTTSNQDSRTTCGLDMVCVCVCVYVCLYVFICRFPSHVTSVRWALTCNALARAFVSDTEWMRTDWETGLYKDRTLFVELCALRRIPEVFKWLKTGGSSFLSTVLFNKYVSKCKHARCGIKNCHLGTHCLQK